jgi:multiple antibiotic resistance protein
MDMLRGNRSTQEGAAEILEGQAKDDVAITPLAIPMLAGPGAISTIMVLSGQARGTSQTIIVYASIVVTLLLSWITLHLAERLVKRIGQTGIRVMTRIMGLLLAAIAVQFVITGIREAMGH